MNKVGRGLHVQCFKHITCPIKKFQKYKSIFKSILIISRSEDVVKTDRHQHLESTLDLDRGACSRLCERKVKMARDIRFRASPARILPPESKSKQSQIGMGLWLSETRYAKKESKSPGIKQGTWYSTPSVCRYAEVASGKSRCVLILRGKLKWKTLFVLGAIQLPKKKALAVSATGLPSGSADASQGKNEKGLHGSEVGRSDGRRCQLWKNRESQRWCHCGDVRWRPWSCQRERERGSLNCGAFKIHSTHTTDMDHSCTLAEINIAYSR